MSLSEIRVNTTKTRTGVGTITYTETGPVITGIATASNFKTGSTNVHSTGVELTNINTGGATATFGGAISGTTASFSGTVSIGGTLTYEDVTNIDSVGILTARAGIFIDDSITHIGDPNTKIRFPANDKITLETSGTERFQVDSNGNVYVGGVGASATAGVLWLNDTAANASKISQDNGNSALVFGTGSGQTEKLRITSDGYVLAGHNTRDANIAHGTAGRTQLWGTSWANAGIALINTQASTDPAFISFAKSRKASATASAAAVHSGDRLGEIRFAGDDGTDMHSFGASIAAYAQGTIAGNRMPGKLVFATTSDAANAVSSSTRMVLYPSGQIDLGTGVVNIASFCKTGNNHQIVGQAADDVAALDVYSQHGNDADRLSFAVSDNRTGSKSNAFVVRGNGFVGINTDNPNKLLEIHTTNTNTYSSADSNTPNPNTFLTLTNKSGGDGSGSGYYAAMRFSIANGATSSGWLAYHRTGDNKGDFTFKSRNAGSSYPELMRIKSTGNVSIGGNTSVGTKLHIENSSGDAHIRLRGSVNYGVLFTRHSDAALLGFVGSGGSVNLGSSNLGITAGLSGGNIVFQTGGTAASDEKLRIDSDGRLLISGQAALTSTSLSHPVQVAADSSAQNIVCFGRASDDIGAIDFYEADKSTLLGELQYRRDHLNLRHRVGSIRFCAAGSTEYMRLTTVTANSVTTGVLGINDTSPEGEALGLVVKNKNYQQTNLPVVHIERQNSAGGGNGSDEVALYTRINTTYNSAGDSYAIKSFGRHNLNSTHFAGHFEAYGSQYDAGGDGAAVYATTHKTDTNGAGYVPCFYAYGRSSYNIASNGYAVGMRIKLNAYEPNRGIQIHHELANSNWTRMISFHKGSGANGTEVGSIKSSNNATQYNTSSDYRLKENVVDLTGAITRLKQLKPKRFNFKNDTSNTVDGFIAHEVEPVVPQAVSGTKDAVKIETVGDPSTGKTIMNEDGTPKIETVIDPQEVDYSKLSTLTIAALQEALAKIETLEAKVAALEGS